MAFSDRAARQAADEAAHVNTNLTPEAVSSIRSSLRSRVSLQGEFYALAGDLARQYHDRARLNFAYDEPLSHLIYAGADILLVPSIFEPCGLTQMIAMRCGADRTLRVSSWTLSPHRRS